MHGGGSVTVRARATQVELAYAFALVPRDTKPVRLTVELPPELVEQVIEEVVRRMRAEQPPESRWLCGAQAAASYLDCPVARVCRSLRRLPHARDGRLPMFNT